MSSFHNSWRFWIVSFLALFFLLSASVLAVIGSNNQAFGATGPVITQTTFIEISPNLVDFVFTTNSATIASMTVTDTAGYNNTLTDTSNTTHEFQYQHLASQTYYYSYTATDTNNNTTSVSPSSFTVPPSSNSFYFHQLAVTINSTSVAFDWYTNQSSSTELDYGLTNAYGQSSIESGERTQHDITLSNLVAGALYHYRLNCVTSDNSSTILSPDMTFTAPGTPATTATTTTVATTTVTNTTTTVVTTTSTTAATTTTASSTTPTNPTDTTATSTTPTITTDTPTINPTTPTTVSSGPILTANTTQLNFSGTSTDLISGLALQTVQITSTGTTQWWVQPFTNTGGNWLSVSPSNGSVNAGNISQFSVSVKSSSLTAGSYSGGIFINNSTNPSQPALIVSISLTVSSVSTTPSATTPVVTASPTPPPSSNFTYYLPFLSNGADGFTTYLTLQNQGSGTANLTLSYFDNTGATFGTAAATSIAAGAQWNPPNGFVTGTKGSGMVVSNQPLNIVVSEATPNGGSAFMLNKITSNSLVAPLMMRRGYGNFDTTLFLMNAGTNSSTIKITYYSSDGTAVQTQNISLEAHASAMLSQDDAVLNLPVGFIGWAKIQGGSNDALSAEVLENNPLIGFTATFGAVATPYASGNPTGAGLTLYAPAVFKNAFGRFYSGMTLVNPNAAPAQVSISYFDPAKGGVLDQKLTIAANSAYLIFHGDNSIGLPANFFGSATITSDQPLVGVLNENGGGSTSGTYNLLTVGGQHVYLPVVANNAYGGYVSGLTVMNLTNSPVSFDLIYYDGQGNPVGSTLHYTLSPHGSQPLYQGDAGQLLPSGFFGTAQLTADTANSLAITTNIANNLFFYTYTAP